MAKSVEVAAPRRLFFPRAASTRALAYYFSFSFLIFLYIGLSFLPMPDKSTLSRYHLSGGQYHALILPIIIFIIIIWLINFYGSVKIKSYAALIRGSEDGRAFNIIGNGLIVLALSSPFLSDLSALFNLIERGSANTLPGLTITLNYVSLALMAAALILIARGGEKLANLPGRRRRLWPEKAWVAAFIIFSSLYGYFLIGQPEASSAQQKVFFMPHWLALLTIAIPYLYIWYRGFKGTAEIYAYQKNVRGKLYKSALTYLSVGISLVIITSIITRVLATLSTHLSRLHLNPILAVIYALLAVMAAGYILIALGAKKLRQIEEA